MFVRKTNDQDTVPLFLANILQYVAVTTELMKRYTADRQKGEGADQLIENLTINEQTQREALNEFDLFFQHKSHKQAAGELGVDVTKLRGRLEKQLHEIEALKRQLGTGLRVGRQ